MGGSSSYPYYLLNITNYAEAHSRYLSQYVFECEESINCTIATCKIARRIFTSVANNMNYASDSIQQALYLGALNITQFGEI